MNGDGSACLELRRSTQCLACLTQFWLMAGAQFVNFTDVMSKTTGDQARRETLFAVRALMEIPEQYKVRGNRAGWSKPQSEWPRSVLQCTTGAGCHISALAWWSYALRLHPLRLCAAPRVPPERQCATPSTAGLAVHRNNPPNLSTDPLCCLRMPSQA